MCIRDRLAALLPMAFAQAAFLPTATEAVIEETPPEHRGLAMALFSQCFAISAIVAPLAGGALLDLQNNGLLLWLLMGGACLVVLPTLRSLKPRYSIAGTIALTKSSKDDSIPTNILTTNSRNI